MNFLNISEFFDVAELLVGPEGTEFYRNVTV